MLPFLGGLFPSVWGIETSDKTDKYDKKSLKSIFRIFFRRKKGGAGVGGGRWGSGPPAAKKSIIFISFVRCGVPHIKSGYVGSETVTRTKTVCVFYPIYQTHPARTEFRARASAL